MGALAAVFTRDGSNAVPIVASMLKALRHRGGEIYGASSPRQVVVAGSPERLMGEVRSSLALGYGFSHILPGDQPQPLAGNGFTLVFEGRLFPPPKGVFDAQEVLRRLAENPVRDAQSLIMRVDGSYVFSLALPGRLMVGRDPLGTRPLYYGWNGRFFAFASERKALWMVGIRNVKSFPPGSLALVDGREAAIQPIRVLRADWPLS